MLKITYTEGENALSLRLEGHAGAGKWGSDIVCAAASILTYTAAAVAQQLYRQGALQAAPHIRLQPGSATVALERCEAAKGLMDVICTGYSLLAVRYPKNVDLIGKENRYESKF